MRESRRDCANAGLSLIFCTASTSGFCAAGFMSKRAARRSSSWNSSADMMSLVPGRCVPVPCSLMASESESFVHHVADRKTGDGARRGDEQREGAESPGLTDRRAEY